MDDYYGKKYKLVSSENFEEYMKIIGIGYLGRKTAATLHPVISLERNNDGTYTYKMESLLANSRVTFVLGEEFDEDRPDGTKVKSQITFEDNKMTHRMREANGKTSIHVREFHADKIVMTTTVNGWNKTAIRTFKIQN